jgi:hypothetical protein
VHPKTPITIEGKPTSLCQWIHEDGSGNHLRMRFMDSTGQTFQVDGPRMTRSDRQFVSFDFKSSKGRHWGGANDGVIHHPMKLETLLLIDSADRTKTAGFVTIEAPTLVYEEPTATSKPR